jgi:signal peptidase I
VSVIGLNGEQFGDLIGQLLRSGHGLRFQASGGSMQPFILNGDILEISPLVVDHLQPGDVLLVQAAEDRLLAHRVIHIRRLKGEPAFQLKGDACKTPDDWFPISQVLGRVVSIDRDGRHFDLAAPRQRLRAWLWVRLVCLAPALRWLPARFRVSIKNIFVNT